MFFIHSSVVGPLGQFHSLVVVNSAVNLVPKMMIIIVLILGLEVKGGLSGGRISKRGEKERKVHWRVKRIEIAYEPTKQ
jgi:hypothetical protein